MLSSVFWKTLYDQRKAILGWGLGLGTLAYFTLLLYPSVQKASVLYDQMLRAFPPEALAFLGNIRSFATIDGYMTGSLLSYLPLVLAIYAIGAAVGLITGEIENGTMDILLAHPLPRWRVVLEKYAALVAALAAICLIFGLSMAAGGLTIGSDVPPGRWLLAGFHLLPLTLLYGSVAFALACAIRGRTAAIATATTLVVGGYILNGLVPLSEHLRPLEKWTVYYWYITGRPLGSGIIPEHVAILLGGSLLCLLAALIAFGRRDILP
ncbi:MAG: ABC transporter permease subunit [Anaerolineae bacterium]|nr:ABC transporter permease [Anaerolineae bacterium]MDW8069355.1 ABC transporter permease subunit [Anaerolineae bacterium]